MVRSPLVFEAMRTQIFLPGITWNCVRPIQNNRRSNVEDSSRLLAAPTPDTNRCRLVVGHSKMTRDNGLKALVYHSSYQFF
jgi:hypothetical protein